MKFDPNKVYPYPVLRPGSSDYSNAEFQVEYRIQRIEETTTLKVEADFQLSDLTLLNLISLAHAQYVLLVRSATTHQRLARCSQEGQITLDFRDGGLAGLTEIRGLITATRCLPALSVPGWRSDYRDATFNIPIGAVLAEDEPKEYWIDTAEEMPVRSVFRLEESDAIPHGRWSCSLDDQRIIIFMSPRDFAIFRKSRNTLNGTEGASYIMNSVYLPALLYVLQEADQDGEGGGYDDYRWYRALNQCLKKAGCPLLGSGEDRIADAQKLLDHPFATIPFMSNEFKEKI